MIRLSIESYCHECEGFEPEMDTRTERQPGGEDATVFELYCARRAMCAKLVRRYKDVDKGASAPDCVCLTAIK